MNCKHNSTIFFKYGVRSISKSGVLLGVLLSDSWCDKYKLHEGGSSYDLSFDKSYLVYKGGRIIENTFIFMCTIIINRKCTQYF